MVSRAAPFVTLCLLLWIAHCQLDIDNPCDTDMRLCGDNAVCMGSDGRYTCTCITGYSGNGTYCYDFDECKLELDNCSEDAFCTNAPGGYSCTCKEGYIGNGTSCDRGCSKSVCEKNPCENATCPGQVEAECVVDLDNCSATWFIDCKDVTHLCQVCNDGDVRLINITNDTNEMLVEICYDSTWGLVCDDQWGANDNNAQVVCKQYCFESGEKGKMCPNLNDGIFWLDEVNCTGDEGRLDNCTHNNIGEHDCTLAEAVTVICSTNVCPEGSKCTQDGNCYTKDENGYKVCGRNVSCTENSMLTNTEGIFYCMCNPGYCCGEDGNCTDIDECAMNTTRNCTNECSYECAMGTHNCTRKGSKCVNTPGSYFCMCLPGYTGNDCEDIDECEDPTLNNCDVNAMCINTPGSFSCMCNNGYFGSGTDCELCYMGDGTDCDMCNPDKPFCLGYTKDCIDIDECELGLDDCDENADCINTEGCYMCICREGYCCNRTICTVSDASTGIRLVDGNETSGLVEVLRYCEWRSVCDDYWTDHDAKVACRQLGLLPYAAGSYRRGKFENDEEVQYWLDDVQCKGDELSLFDCPHKDTHNCGRRERAGVHCLGKDDVAICLVENTTLYSGIIDLKIRNESRSVCHDQWTDEDAQVACKSMGLPFTGAKKEIDGRFEPGEEVTYWLSQVNCQGDEESLLACMHCGVGNHNCGKDQRAKVICQDIEDRKRREAQVPPCKERKTRVLTNESQSWKEGEGLVQICWMGQWRFICDDGWDINAARVFCREHELLTEDTAITSFHYHFDNDINQVHYWLDDIQCTGEENGLMDCEHERLGIHNCAQDEIAAVICNGTEQNVTLEPYPGGTAYGPFSNKGLKQIDYAIGAVATVEVGVICGLIEFDLEDNGTITVEVDILGLKATERYDWGINDDATGTCKEIPFDPDWFLENCNYDKHCKNYPIKAECAAGDYTQRFGSLDGSGRKRVLENRTLENRTNEVTLQALLNNSFFINIEGVALCGKLMPVFECEENDIVMKIVANDQFLGPIEVCVHNRWHRVCDSNWTKADATVACKQLKLPFTDAVAVYFNEGEVLPLNGQNVTDGCECIGTESFYIECIEYPPIIRPRGKNDRIAGALCQEKEEE